MPELKLEDVIRRQLHNIESGMYGHSSRAEIKFLISEIRKRDEALKLFTSRIGAFCCCYDNECGACYLLKDIQLILRGEK